MSNETAANAFTVVGYDKDNKERRKNMSKKGWLNLSRKRKKKNPVEVRIEMNKGFLIAQESSDTNYPGICIMFEALDGTLVDVALAECKEENDRKQIDVYCYEDVYNEDYTRKYTLDSEEIIKALTTTE